MNDPLSCILFCAFLFTFYSVVRFGNIVPCSSHYCPTILTQAHFIAVSCQVIAAAGLPNVSSFQGHSFHHGAAVWAFHHGVLGELIQIYRDWPSDAHKAYLEFSVKPKLTLPTSFILLFSLVLLHGAQLCFLGMFSSTCFGFISTYHIFTLSGQLEIDYNQIFDLRSHMFLMNKEYGDIIPQQ